MVIQAKGTITLTDDFSGWNGDVTHPAYGARLVNNSGTYAVNVTIFGFNGNYKDGLRVESKGMITFKDSYAIDNTGNGAYLNNDISGATAGVSVLNTPDYVNLFNDNGSDGLEIHSKGTVLVTSARANGNTESGFYIYAANGTGTVTLDGARGTTANGNGEHGIWVISNGAITIKNMDAGDNAYNGFDLSILSGTGGVNVLVTIPGWHNGLQNNGHTGLSIISNGPVVVQKTFANNNQEYGAYIDNTGGTGNVTITDSDFNNNAKLDTGGDVEYGLFILSRGVIAVTNINANDNGFNAVLPGDDVHGSGAWLDNSASSTPKAITITKGNFNNNFGTGLDVIASGAITYKTGSVNNNDTCGASLDNRNAVSNQNATVDTVNFSGNGKGIYGLYIRSKGNILVTATDVNGFGGNGMDLVNTYGTGTVTVSGTSSWWRYFGNNTGSGIGISTNGTVSLNYLNVSDNYEFGAYIQTNGTTATVTLNNLNFINNGLNGDSIDRYGVKVIAKGNITLDKVLIADNKNFGAYLENQAGTGTVTIKSATGSEIRNNAGYGLRVLSKGNITLTNIQIHDNGEDGHTNDYGAWLDNSIGTTGSVTINNTMYTSWQNNKGFGLQIYSNGAVTINLVDAFRNNGTNGNIDNSTAPGTATPAVTITNSWFNESQNGYGLIVASKGNITLTNVDASGNNKVAGGLGVTINNAVAGGKGNVTITGVSADDKNSFNDNADYGLFIASNGTVTIKWVEALNNGRYGASIDNSTAATPLAVSLIESIFNDNAKSTTGFGLTVFSRGAITGTRVFAQNNGNWDTSIVGNGMYLDNCVLDGGYCTGTGAVTLSGAGGYSNYGDGLSIRSYGAINLSDVGAGWNNGNGGTFYNYYGKLPNPALPVVKSTAGVTISLPAGLSTEWGIFSNNGGYGLMIGSNGAVSVAYVNVNGNNNTAYSYAAYIDNSYAATPMPVTISRSKFNENTNAAFGIFVLSKGAITFSNNEVKGNQGSGGPEQGAAYLRNSISTSPQNVTVTSSIFGNNSSGNGLFIETKGNTLLTNITAYGNSDGGVLVDATLGNGTVTLNGSRNSFNGNGDKGVEILANGNVSVTNITAEYNTGDGLYIATYGVPLTGSGTGKVTVTNANLNHNNSNGLWISAKGVTNLTNVTSLGNGISANFDGAYIITNFEDVNITNSSFSGNYGAGIRSNTGDRTLKLVGTSFYGNDVNTTGDQNLYYTGNISIS